jgi:hypothetical protein
MPEVNSHLEDVNDLIIILYPIHFIMIDDYAAP